MISLKFTTTTEKIAQSNRNGSRGTIYGVKRKENLANKDIIYNKAQEKLDLFTVGSNYKGEWKDDKKHGFGTEAYPDGCSYSGQWLEGKRHGRGTFWVVKNKKSVHQYVGEWFEGNMEGYGVYYYDNGDEYKGDWKRSKRWGSGRLDYHNGDYYMGEWENDHQHGLGTYHFKNGNIYEGMWIEGKKEGKGRFFYASTRKVYEGEWVHDQPKCGEFRDPYDNEETRFGKADIRKETFSLPPLGLKDHQEVLDNTIAEIRNENMYRRGISDTYFPMEVVEEAAKVFHSLDKHNDGVINVYSADNVFIALGMELSKEIIRDILRLVDYQDQPLVSLADILDIASCILSRDVDEDI